MLADDASRRKTPLTVERVAPALVRLAQGEYAGAVAEEFGVSTTTVLNWMDFGWRNQNKIEDYLREHHPELDETDLQALWQRMQRRQAKRRRRTHPRDVLSDSFLPRRNGQR